MTIRHHEEIETIRSASRSLVRELGFMGRNLAETDLSPSGVHALLEIGNEDDVSAKHLSETLLLEKSTVSRLVRTLLERGEVREVVARHDGRVKYLNLTAKGRDTLAAIDRFAVDRVTGAINPLPSRARSTICDGLAAYARALKAGRTGGGASQTLKPATIRTGYEPGLVGHIAKMHGLAYHKLDGFGARFEAKVAGGLAEFATRLENPVNEIWTARINGRIIGSIAIDGENLGKDTAHLRWFLVEDGGRGSGVGSRLLQEAIGHCNRHGFGSIKLWTYKGLDVARKLYEKNGFVLAEEYSGDQWGRELREQTFIRKRSTTGN
ncbi:GNAT family N-acetyltransferase [Hoeflea sp. TYP-13]|uniref:bifunctional helix-turn-helix transcriptional regulator/GNAT family N-acetyltransferase n=1 Tax=Hoeflea sp. TYP-13 TaxID=3230023 RepID=UPI0034C61980